MKGAEVIERGDIVVTDNRITAVGPAGKVAIPAGAVIRDLKGKTIMPGWLMCMRTWVAWGVHRAQVSQFLAQLAFGVTTQRDPQTSSEDALTYQDLMDAASSSDRLYSTGPESLRRTTFAVSRKRGMSFAATRITTTPRPSSSTWRVTARCGSG